MITNLESYVDVGRWRIVYCCGSDPNRLVSGEDIPRLFMWEKELEKSHAQSDH